MNSMASIDADLDLLKSAALEAGALALSFFRQNPNAWSKDGGSPVTEADMAVDTFLRTRLLAARGHYGWLSEETADDPARRSRDAVFVVDPIDGTRGFIAGDDRWCISLALVRGRRPHAAVLYAPARNELFTAARGEGSWLHGRRLSVSNASEFSSAGLAGPRGWLKSGRFADAGAIRPYVPSLAYRFAGVARGGLDAAFAGPRAHDWDLAACDLLVHEAGGRLVDLQGVEPAYNGETPSHGVLAAANALLLPQLLARLRQVARERADRRLPH
jgi:myo-inositol-1(or 4)-monophosphatase